MKNENQLSMFGSPPEKAKRNNRLFLALLPDDDTAAEITALGRRLRADCGLRGNLLPPERLHVSLYHLGDYAAMPQGVIERTKVAAQALVFPPFEISFGRVTSFGGRGRRPLVLRCSTEPECLSDFRHALGLALSETGFGRITSGGFTPHLTLLYDELSIPEQSITPVSWQVRDFVLVHSLVGQGRYTRLGAWPLCSAPH